MILHIVHDEKFIDIASKIFEGASPSNNEYVILSAPSKLKYIKQTPVQFVEPKDFSKLYSNLNSYEMVIFHCLTDVKLKFLSGIQKSVKLVWIGWGCDYYDLVNKDLAMSYRSKTLDLYSKNRLGFFQVFFRRLRKNFSAFKSGVKDKRDLISKFDYFSPVLPEEYTFVTKSLKKFPAKYVSWNYGTLEDDFIRGFEGAQVSGENILLGNSATYSNNHLDIIDVLSQTELHNAKIICPLSYGNMEYQKDVLNSGKAVLQERFHPVTSFMPIEEYTALISSCSIVIMGHLIQQGLGNIVTMLYMGAKVFLDAQNPIYSFFKEQDAYIYSIENFEQEKDGKLTLDQIEFNRSVLRKHWSKQVIESKTKNLIKTVSEAQ